MNQLASTNYVPSRTTRGTTLEERAHRERVLNDLKRAGAGWYGMLKLETSYLPLLIHPDETLAAAVYGFNDDGSVMMVATDRRIIYLDKKPMFIKSDDITYDVVSGVSYGHTGPFTTVTLHTRLGDFSMHLVSLRCAKRFVEFIERRCLEHQSQEHHPAWSQR